MPDLDSLVMIATQSVEDSYSTAYIPKEDGSDESKGFEPSPKRELSQHDLTLLDSSSENLSLFQARIYSRLIDNLIQQLQISDAHSDCTAPIDIRFRTLEEKYGATKYNPEHFKGAIADTCDMKFQRDKRYLEKILTDLNVEMISTLETKIFTERLEDYEKSEKESEELLVEARANLEKKKTLKHLLANSRCRLKERLQAKCQELDSIKATYEDLVYEYKNKGEYNDIWEKTRTYQNNLTLTQQEAKLTNSIQSSETDIINETRINWETEYFENQLISDYQGLIEIWTERHDTDFDKKQVEIQTLKDKREAQELALEKLRDNYNGRQKEMEDYLVAREIRREQDERMEMLSRNATKIQAWWRGVMYRRRLGPYRKKSKKAGKGKKK